jgi:5-methylcytosine-specific restriction protein B
MKQLLYWLDFRGWIDQRYFAVLSLRASVESFDFALRRRFLWNKIMPDIKVLRQHLKENNSEW